MAYRHQIDTALNDRGGPDALSRAEFDTLLAQLAPVLAELHRSPPPGARAILHHTTREDDLEGIEMLAGAIRERYEELVVIGAGGSGLSSQTLAILRHPQPVISQQPPRLSFLDNIDPDAMSPVLQHLDLKRTAFFVVSKSGTTVETLGHVGAVLHALQAQSIAAGGQFYVMTMQGNSPLRRIAEHYGMHLLEHDPDLGGRFSVFSAIGLLPAAVTGMDIRALRRGARRVAAACREGEIARCEPARGAVLQAGLIAKGKRLSVFMPYSDRLGGLAMWYRQSWAESLGKHGQGSTPVRARGTTDQHSQLQLYLDGPRDKLFTLLLLERAGSGQSLLFPDAAKSELAYLAGKTTGDIMAAEQKATLRTLCEHGCPVRSFLLPALDEETFGGLLMHFMLEIIFTARLLGVDPFDQPAVERSKQLAREYLAAGTL